MCLLVSSFSAFIIRVDFCTSLHFSKCERSLVQEKTYTNLPSWILEDLYQLVPSQTAVALSAYALLSWREAVSSKCLTHCLHSPLGVLITPDSSGVHIWKARCSHREQIWRD